MHREKKQVLININQYRKELREERIQDAAVDYGQSFHLYKDGYVVQKN
jgi:hypothetical protein